MSFGSSGKQVGGASGALSVITRTVVGVGGVANIDWQSIAQTYEDLVIRAVARTTSGNTSDELFLRINGISTSTYHWNGVVGTNGAVSNTQNDGSSIQCSRICGGGATAGRFSIVEIVVPAYARAAADKVVRYSQDRFQGTGGSTWVTERGSGWAEAATAVSRLTLTPGAGNFAQDSVFTLYGVSSS